MANDYNEVTNRLHSVRVSESPNTDHIVSGADEIYDDVAPYRTNGHIDCTAVTPVGTENPVGLRWYERINYGTEQEPQYEWIRSQDTTVDNQKTYGIPTGAKQSDINDQLYEMTGDIDKVVLYANEYEEITNPPAGSNPQANGWYELSGSTYVLTTDTTVVSGKTYYARVAHISPDENKIVNQQDGYIPTAGAVGRAMGANFEDNLTSTSTVKGLTANQGRVLNEKKADKNGWYEQLVAGASLSVIGDDTDNKAKFFYRETGDSEDTGGTKHTIEKGTATINEIGGNTIKFNQVRPLIPLNRFSHNGSLCVLSTSDNGNTYTITAASATTNYESFYKYTNDSYFKPIPSGHQVYINKGTSSTYIIITGYNNQNTGEGGVAADRKSKIFTVGANGSFSGLNIGVMAGFSGSVNLTPYYIDLNTIFGSDAEIAAALGISTSDITTDTGVASFEAWLTQNVGYQDYYPYNTGSLISLKPKKLVSTGVNLYNHTTGTARVQLGKQYKLTGTNTGAAYSDGTAITLSDSLFTASKDDTITISGGNSTSTFLYLVLNNDTSKTFESYKTSEVDLSWIMDIPDPNDSSKKLFPYGLLSAGSVHDEVRGNKVIKRVGVENLGNLTYIEFTAANGVYRGNFSGKNATLGTGNQTCVKYKAVSNYNTLMATNDTCTIMNVNGIYLFIHDLTLANKTPTEVKEALNNYLIYYELNKPIEVTFEEPDTHPMNYEVEPGGTEEFVKADAALGENEPTSTSLTATIIYPMNTLQTIRNLETNLATLKTNYRASIISLAGAVNSAIGGGITYTEDPEGSGDFDFTYAAASNTQSVENESI